MDLDLLTELVEAYKQYQVTRPAGSKSSLTDFAIWVNKREYGKVQAADSSHEDVIGRNDIDTELSKLIIFLNRYARHLIRKALAGFPELVHEDVTYLYTLMGAGSMTKMQLIEKNVHEKPGGLEVIKRLLKHGLIAERADDRDKRSKRVFLTEKGRAAFYQTLDQMEKVSGMVTGNLSPDEKKQLFVLMKKLEDFHNPIFLGDKKLSIDELRQKWHQPG